MLADKLYRSAIAAAQSSSAPPPVPDIRLFSPPSSPPSDSLKRPTVRKREQRKNRASTSVGNGVVLKATELPSIYPTSVGQVREELPPKSCQLFFANTAIAMIAY